MVLMGTHRSLLWHSTPSGSRSACGYGFLWNAKSPESPACGCLNACQNRPNASEIDYLYIISSDFGMVEKQISKSYAVPNRFPCIGIRILSARIVT